MPNFTALREWCMKQPWATNAKPLATWIGKLESWCTESLKANTARDDKVQKVIEESDAKIDEANEATRVAEGRVEYLNGLLELLEDMDRGVKDARDLDEYIGLIPDA